ncbi:MAG: GntR family transcriptional regulator [Planctomycetota bacterium]
MTDIAGALRSDQPMVRQIQVTLRDKILAGELAPGEKLPSMRKLSADFGCSLGIVKQAVTTLAAQGYLRSSPRRGVYVADAMPAGREVVIILPNLEINRLHLAIIGVKRALGNSGHRISLHAGDAPSTADMPDALASSSVAGVLVLLPSSGEHDELLMTLRRRAVPTVVVDITARTVGADVVAIDPVEAGRVGAAYLIEHGHRRLAVALPENEARLPKEVADGFSAALRAAGQDPALAPRVAVDRTDLRGDARVWSAAAERIEALLRSDPAITGIVGLGSQMTLGAALGARRAGRSIPGDCSIVGLLGDSSALQAFDPPITIFDNPLQDVCEAATRRLMERVDGLNVPAECLRRPPVFIDRSSVARIG